MSVKNEDEITGEVAKQMRESAGMTQAAFWEPLGVHQSSGCHYEASDKPVPKPVRILLYLRYVQGVAFGPEPAPKIAKVRAPRKPSPKKSQ